MKQPDLKSNTDSNGSTLGRNTTTSSAFTIVELLIVVVVIAILATITIVAYNGTQARARASAASQALSQAKKKLELYKVDTGTYPTTGNLATAGITNGDTTYQYTSTGTSYCMTATNGTVSYYLDSTTQFTPAQGGCTDHTYQGGVQMTNLVTNGDFSNGTTGWSSVYGTHTIANNINSLTGNGGASSSSIISTSTKPVAPGNKAYIYMQGRVTNAVSKSMSVRIQGSTSGNTAAQVAATILNPLSDTWYVLSGIITQPPEYKGYIQIRTFQSYATTTEQTGKQMDTKYFVVLDLTEIFGAGNEPTKEQMDAIMQQFPNSWFNGTVTANTLGIL